MNAALTPPKPYSDNPTQWIFHGHPRPAASPLQITVARLLGYHWPAELQSRSGVPPLAEERHDDTSTITSVEAASRRLETRRDGASTLELSDEARAWIDKTEALHAFEDKDGIVCLPSIRGEPAAHERLLHLLDARLG